MCLFFVFFYINHYRFWVRMLNYCCGQSCFFLMRVTMLCQTEERNTWQILITKTSQCEWALWIIIVFLQYRINRPCQQQHRVERSQMYLCNCRQTFLPIQCYKQSFIVSIYRFIVRISSNCSCSYWYHNICHCITTNSS